MKIKILVILLGFGALACMIPPSYDLDYPDYFPEPTYDFSENPISAEKIKLGQALFYDPIMSIDSSISCESCHSPFNSFGHSDQVLGIGIHDSVGTRNAPVIINLAWSKFFMLDGASVHLDTQAISPIESQIEMGETFPNITRKLNNSDLYKGLFYKAFQDSVATKDRILKALSSFQLSLISAGSKYDQVLKGEAEFNERESRGYSLFKTHCSTCHEEPLFTSGSFANNGLSLDPQLNDIGRAAITNDPLDSFKFKIPTLRNLSYSYTYMHDGRFTKLSEVLNHYRNGIHVSESLAPELKDSIIISDEESIDILAFLISLNDQEFVVDASHEYPFDLFGYE